MDISIRMIELDRVYIITRGRIVGRPEISSETGEISGLKIAADNMRQSDGRSEVECCSNAGARIIITIDGKQYPTTGGVTIRPWGVESEAQANDDGSLAITNKPVPREVDIKFRDHCGLRMEQLMGCSA